MPKNDTLSKKLQNQFHQFLQDHSPRAFNCNLRTMVLDYLHADLEHGLPYNQKRFLNAMTDFFCLMDLAMEEMGDLPPWHGE